jgi:hypothetical protein
LEAALNAERRSSLKVDITYVNGVWEVVIFDGDQTEHRSFHLEKDAREYAAARMEQLQLGKPKSKSDGATT